MGIKMDRKISKKIQCILLLVIISTSCFIIFPKRGSFAETQEGDFELKSGPFYILTRVFEVGGKSERKEFEFIKIVHENDKVDITGLLKNDISIRGILNGNDFTADTSNNADGKTILKGVLLADGVLQGDIINQLEDGKTVKIGIFTIELLTRKIKQESAPIQQEIRDILEKIKKDPKKALKNLFKENIAVLLILLFIIIVLIFIINILINLLKAIIQIIINLVVLFIKWLLRLLVKDVKKIEPVRRRREEQTESVEEEEEKNNIYTVPVVPESPHLHERIKELFEIKYKKYDLKLNSLANDENLLYGYYEDELHLFIKIIYCDDRDNIILSQIEQKETYKRLENIFSELCYKHSSSYYSVDECQLSPDLNQKIVSFLITLPNIHDNSMKQALTFAAGLDPKLYHQLNLNGSPAQFIRTLVNTLIHYGTLEDGQNSLEALLNASKEYVGKNRRVHCDMLIQELQGIPMASNLDSHAREAEDQIQHHYPKTFKEKDVIPYYYYILATGEFSPNSDSIPLICQTEDEFINSLIDFSRYFKNQLIDSYAKSKIYSAVTTEDNKKTLAETFVPPLFYTDDDVKNVEDESLESAAKPRENLKRYVDDWLSNSSDNKHLALLGDYGMGKTSFLKYYAATLAQDILDGRPVKRFPVLISLTNTSPRHGGIIKSIAEFVACYLLGVDYELFEKLIHKGKILFLLDAFDEMGFIGTHEQRVKQFREIWRLAVKNNKIILSGRPSYFPTEFELRQALNIPKKGHEHIQIRPYSERIVLTYLDDDRISTYITRYRSVFKLTSLSFKNLETEGIPNELLGRLRLLENKRIASRDKFLHSIKQLIGTELFTQYKGLYDKYENLILKHAYYSDNAEKYAMKAMEWIKKNSSIHDLCRRPSMMHIVREMLPILFEKYEDKTLNAREMMEQYLDFWYNRQMSKSTVSALEDAELKKEFVFDFFKKLAVRFFLENKLKEDNDRILIRLRRSIENNYELLYKLNTKDKLEGFENEMRTAYFIEIENNDYRFVHKSFYEYFVSSAIIDCIQRKDFKNEFFNREWSPEIISYVCDAIPDKYKGHSHLPSLLLLVMEDNKFLSVFVKCLNLGVRLAPYILNSFTSAANFFLGILIVTLLLLPALFLGILTLIVAMSADVSQKVRDLVSFLDSWTTDVFRLIMNSYRMTYIGKQFTYRNSDGNVLFFSYYDETIRQNFPESMNSHRFKNNVIYYYYIEDMDFEQIQFVTCTFFKTIFRNVNFEKTSFKQCTFFGSVIFDNCNFNKVQFENINLLFGSIEIEATPSQIDQYTLNYLRALIRRKNLELGKHIVGDKWLLEELEKPTVFLDNI